MFLPGKKNMEVWYQKKFEKQISISNSIKPNGWSLHLFAIIVGAKEYCLSGLGFVGKLLKPKLRS